MEFIKSNIFILIVFAGGISSVLLFIKFLIKKEPVILASSITRLAVCLIATFHVGLRSVYPFMAIGLFTLLLSDIISNLVYFFSRKYFVETQKAHLLGVINNLLGKVNYLVNNPYIGYFTLNEDGIIEFANEKLVNLMNLGNLEGKSIFSFFDNGTVKEIREKSILSKDSLLIVNGNTKKIKLTTAHTVNGHRTITGSIIDYETITG